MEKKDTNWKQIALSLVALAVALGMFSYELGVYITQRDVVMPILEYNAHILQERRELFNENIEQLREELRKLRLQEYERVIEYREIEVEVPVVEWEIDWQELEDFSDIGELESFLEQDDTDSHIILKAGADGVIAFGGQCEDFALQLIARAEAVGKRLYFLPMHRSEYAKWYGEALEIGTYHAICCAVIGNDIYYIEPQTDKCWKALELD